MRVKLKKNLTYNEVFPQNNLLFNSTEEIRKKSHLISLRNILLKIVFERTFDNGE